MSKLYCKEHTRIELEDGKCVACGEVAYDIPNEMSEWRRIKWVLFFFGIFFSLFSLLMYLTS